MKHYSRVEELEIRADDLKEIIQRFKDHRARLLRLRRGASFQMRIMLGDQLAVNARTLTTLITTLGSVESELRHEKARSAAPDAPAQSEAQPR